jgi:hypothetical protein
MWNIFLIQLGYTVEVKEFIAPLEVLWKRDSLRANGVGQDVIYKQYKQWRVYKGERVYVPNTTLPKAYIFDVDGTLADMDGVRGPFDWDKVGLDKPRGEVISLLYGLSLAEFSIIIMSGRDGSCKGLTEEWFEANAIPYDEFFIRPAGNNEKDTIIKERMFFEEVADRYNVLGVVDDRSSVCRLWEAIGLNVINVGCPWEEF